MASRFIFMVRENLLEELNCDGNEEPTCRLTIRNKGGTTATREQSLRNAFEAICLCSFRASKKESGVCVSRISQLKSGSSRHATSFSLRLSSPRLARSENLPEASSTSTSALQQHSLESCTNNFDSRAMIIMQRLFLN